MAIISVFVILVFLLIIALCLRRFFYIISTKSDLRQLKVKVEIFKLFKVEVEADKHHHHNKKIPDAEKSACASGTKNE
ncbi:MAG: hypothetical protein FWC67_05335 [Defluviitaleaceae bacterium]|nr:hypothetical protein [Defluviitaleaceae bacterium]